MAKTPLRHHLGKLLFPFWICACLMIWNNTSQAQAIPNPKFEIGLSKEKIRVGDTVEVILRSDQLPDSWVIYGCDFDPNLGPIVSEVTFSDPKGYQPSGSLSNPGAKRKMDDVWGGEITYMSGRAEFRHKIVITSDSPEIRLNLRYQICSEVTGICVMKNHSLSVHAKTVGTK